LLQPVLVAAAVDYELVTTGQYGSLTRLLQDKILARRRQTLGLDPIPPTVTSGIPGQLTPEQKVQRETEGGVVIIGRHTLKEYMEGLKRGWMGPVFKVDREGDLARKLEFDGVFEEKRIQEDGSMDDMTGASSTSTPTTTPEPAPAPAPPSSGGLLGGLGQLRKHTLQQAAIAPSPSAAVIDPETRITPEMHAPPSPLPPFPPMLLVPWINNLGFKQLPYMFIGLFTEHKKVKEGGEAALKLILGGQRDFVGREAKDAALALPSETATGSDVTEPTSDLDFDVMEEGYYKKDFKHTLSRIEKNRTEYYEDKLKPKLQATRELAAGREPTKEEVSKPPPSEADLRKERQDKEFTWTKQAEGYDIVKKGSEVPWDERWKGWLKVYTSPEEHDVSVEGL
jgi:mitochondrial import inner membrane translocase subunit TIM54